MKHLSFLLSLTLLVMTSCGHDNSDRLTFDLNGPATQVHPSVFEISNTAAAGHAEFSSDGNLLTLNGIDVTVENGSYTILRDKNGRIESIISEEGEEEKTVTYTYNNKGQVAGYTVYWINLDFGDEPLGWEVTRTFNDDGLVTVETFENPEGATIVYTYTYTEFDDQGNWTSRQVSEPGQNLVDYPESRTIIY